MKISFVFCLLLIYTAKALPQRTIFIPVEQFEIDGADMRIKPGDTIAVNAGNRDALLIKNITGTALRPIIIINYGGRVKITTDLDYGILFERSRYFKLTGTGWLGDSTGIEIAKSSNHGVWINEFSSDAEVDHLLIHHVGYAGIVAKTDPNCDRRNVSRFIMYNIIFHDNVIHDTEAEGFYIGYSWFPFREFRCGVDSVRLYSHEIHGIRIYNNRIFRTGQEGIQVGCGTQDVKIYQNTVINYGTKNIHWHNHGVQIGQGTTGEFFNNRVDTGPGEAISLFGRGDNFIYNNIIKNSGVSAIYQNDRGAVKGSRYEIHHNTFINPGTTGVVLVANKTRRNRCYDNQFYLDDSSKAMRMEGEYPWKLGKNKVFPLKVIDLQSDRL